MENIFFEKHHKPTGSFPYVEFSNKNLSYLSHYHEEIEIVFVEKGETKAYCGEREIILATGDICIFMPGEIHSFYASTENNVYIIKIKADSYIENIEFDGIRPVDNKISCNDEEYDGIAEIIKEMRREYNEQEQGYEFSIRELKNRLITYILRKIPLKDVKHSPNIYLLNEVNKYTELNFAEKITLENMAEYCHMSKFYFAHMFKELTGMGFAAYLSLFRLEKAMILLKYTNKNMTEIAFECGFGSVRSFNRIFREKMNVPPLSYRKLATNKTV